MSNRTAFGRKLKHPLMPLKFLTFLPITKTATLTLILLLQSGCSCDKCSYDAAIKISNLPSFDTLKYGLSRNSLHSTSSQLLPINKFGVQEIAIHITAYQCGASTKDLFKPKEFLLRLKTSKLENQYVCNIGADGNDVNGEFVASVDFKQQCKIANDE